MNTNHLIVEELRWKKFPLLNDGYVCLVDCMGDDAAVVQAARLSYGNDGRDSGQTVDGLSKADSNLLRYLMRQRHTTPFEQCEVKLKIRIPMDAWRQMVRHRTASINEYSTRYTEAIDVRQTTNPDEWRLQSTSNKQGSSGENVTEWPEGILSEDGKSVYFSDHPRPYNPDYSPGQYLTAQEEQFHDFAAAVYHTRLKMGVAKEVARKDLPLSTYTEVYWKCDLHNVFHFLGLRMDSHAQKEIRDYATVIGEQIIKPLFPHSWQAFMDYRFNAMNLTALDIEMIKRITGTDPCSISGLIFDDIVAYNKHSPIFTNDRELKECYTKLERLGFCVAD